MAAPDLATSIVVKINGKNKTLNFHTHSDPVYLGTATTHDEGIAALNVVLPERLPAGASHSGVTGRRRRPELQCSRHAESNCPGHSRTNAYHHRTRPRRKSSHTNRSHSCTHRTTDHETTNYRRGRVVG
jgi:hypothetical protein